VAPEAIVRLDGEVIDPAALGVPRPVNPGSHEVSVNVPSHPEWRVALRLAAEERRDLLVATPAAGAPVEETPSGGSRRLSGFVVGGIGAASIVVGAVTGGVAFAKKSDVINACAHGCTQAAHDLASTGKTIANVSTATFVIGAAAVVAGVILLLTDRQKPAPSISANAIVLRGGGGLALTGKL